MPYIPVGHEKYDLLPKCRKRGGEVFSYPSEELSVIETLLPKGEGLTPYGYESYAEYDAEIDRYSLLYGFYNGELNDLGCKLMAYKEIIRKMNVKENWSVLKYIGETAEGCFGLTCGKYYYWPCSLESPEYEGVIDDEEFTSYLYTTAAELWEIAEDPLGMAAKTPLSIKKI